MHALLLHMHQPDYRDPATREPTMPWVRLHATRGYHDVPWLIGRMGAKATVNLVPSLIDQWAHYAAGGTDAHLRLCRRPADTLAAHEIDWMLEHFFHGNPALFGWFPAYGALRARRDARERFDVAALRDLQTWCNLAWFGFSTLEEHPELAALRAKGERFTEAEKEHVLDVQIAALARLPSLYRALPEVSATPYYHPILPLLVDTAHARRCLPGVPTPAFATPRMPAGSSPWEIQGRGVHRPPGPRALALRGLGQPQVLALAREEGFAWFATDQGVLERSEREPGDHRGAWEIGGLRALFRDRDSSDRVGFLYASWDGAAAAADLHARLGPAPALLALDGENPWEGYRDAGRGLLGALLAHPELVTAGELAATPPRRIRRIHTGSWIHADFRIWIGHEEDRAGWSLLAEVRAAWEAAGRPEAARHAMMAAEGSDWFWWFGQFSTPFAGEFDRLFRAHLQAVCRVLGIAGPDALKRPIKRQELGVIPPTHPLHPATTDDWYTWAGAGRVPLRAGAMAPMAGVPALLRYGWRAGRLALGLVPDLPGWSVQIDGKALHPLPAELPRPERPVAVVLRGPDGQRLPAEGSFLLPPTRSVPRPAV